MKPEVTGRLAGPRRVLGRRLSMHDRHQLELKLEYQPEPGEERSSGRYRVEFYLFVPRTLNVEQEAVPRESLYADLHNYIRLKTPLYDFADLEQNPASPLVLLPGLLTRVAAGGDPGPFVLQCRLFGACFRAALRDVGRGVREAMPDGVVDEAGLAEVAAVVDEAIAAARRVLARFRELAPEAAALPERARAAYTLVEEYTSVSVEVALRRVMVGLARAPRGEAPPPASRAIRERLLDFILEEEAHRRGRGFPTVIDPHGDNEVYLSRIGLLKKYCSGVLFLTVEQRAVRGTWQELAFAVAAGIAMAFATLVAFWAQSKYAPLGLQLFLLLVVAYMFKDRLKDRARVAFAALLERHLVDREILVEDSAGNKLGRLREKIEYARLADLPDDVRAARRHGVDPLVQIAEEELRESIIHYEKEIELDARVLAERRHAGLTDILRFNVERLLHDMDEPEEEIEYVDRHTHGLTVLRAAKTYRVDAVVRLEDRPGRSQVTVYRMVLDRNGIKRMEKAK